MSTFVYICSAVVLSKTQVPILYMESFPHLYPWDPFHVFPSPAHSEMEKGVEGTLGPKALNELQRLDCISVGRHVRYN